jgi:hypothetical protein
MDVLTHNQVERLMLQTGRFCVSLYMPTPRTGAETLEGPIHLKNLLRDAEERLLAAGMRAPLVREYLEPARALVADRPFWQHLGDGLAVFLSPDGVSVFRLPQRFEPLVVVGQRFLIAPLLPIDASAERFFILALSQNAVRLLEASRYDVRTVETGAMPTALADALKYDDPDAQFQYHTASPAPGPLGARGPMIGHGTGLHDIKLDLERFFRKVDAGLVARLHEENAPLVLAGVDYLLPIYRGVSTYPHLVDAVLPGNAEGLSAEELRLCAWPLVKPLLGAAREAAASRCRELLAKGDGRAAGSVEAIMPAADSGRVATLFVADDVHCWGTYDPATLTTRIHAKEQPGDDELIDLAAARTLLNRGTVYTVKREEVPGGRPAAAVLRY